MSPGGALMTFAIRTLSSGDVNALAALNAMFAIAFEDPNAYSSSPPQPAYLARLLARDTFIAVVARVDDAIVGGLTAYVLDKAEQERQEIYIYDLAVIEDFRRRGIATALITHLQAIATERGAYCIFVQADLVDGPAIALYERLGVKETAHHFDIPVPAER
jgi:aminoglycoside 3-N-acetyltransferase I